MPRRYVFDYVKHGDSRALHRPMVVHGEVDIDQLKLLLKGVNKSYLHDRLPASLFMAPDGRIILGMHYPPENGDDRTILSLLEPQEAADWVNRQFFPLPAELRAALGVADDPTNTTARPVCQTGHVFCTSLAPECKPPIVPELPILTNLITPLPGSSQPSSLDNAEVQVEAENTRQVPLEDDISIMREVIRKRGADGKTAKSTALLKDAGMNRRLALLALRELEQLGEYQGFTKRKHRRYL